MVFSSKLKISQSHSDKSSDNQENDKDNKQDAVYGVDPMSPHAGKYVVKFNIDSTEWQETCHCHLRNSFPVPRQWWDLSRIFCGATRGLKLRLTILPSNTS